MIDEYEKKLENQSLTIHKAASFVVSRGLETPISFFLELHKPLLSLMHTTSLILTPLATPIFGANKILALNSILEDKKKVEMLICEIEKQSKEKNNPK